MTNAATPTCSSTRCASWPTSAPAPPAPRSRSCSAARRHLRAQRARRCRSPRPSRPPARPRTSHRRRARRRRRDGRHRAAARARRRRRRAAVRLLGVEADTEIGRSALGEIGNIVGTSYINALATMTGIELEPAPPRRDGHARRDRRDRAGRPHSDADDSRWSSTPSSWSRARTARSRSCCSPTPAGVVELLHRIGLGD